MRNLCLLCVLIFWPALCFGQAFPLFEPLETGQVATLNQERLFSESRFGQSFIKEFEARASQIAQENREIETALEAEELELTRLRATENPETFQRLAEAFDQKANRIREERRQEAQSLVEFQETAQQRFFRQVGPVLLELMREQGISVIINNEAVVLSLPTVDLTNDAIERIDSVFPQ